MSSRGYNHRGGCTCRFCQPPAAGEAPSTTADLLSVAGASYSYTFPTTCPICGDAVFLFVSEHGGTVFFDELGPPWPKHPCTDATKAASLTTSTSEDEQMPVRRYSWQVAGWLPITEILVEFADSNNIRLRGIHNGQQFAARVPLSDLGDLSDPVAELARSPIHARLTVAGAYEVAFLSSDARPKMVAAVRD